jgi:hypothetical protein
VEIDEDSRPIRTIRLPDLDLASMLDSFNVGIGPGVFIARRALTLVGLRDTNLLYTGDLDYWFRVVGCGRLVHLTASLATHRVHSASASVARQGEQMAREVVALAERSCANPQLPPEFRQCKNLILAKAHFAASSYCGANLRTGLSHVAHAFILSPVAFPLTLAARSYRHIRYRVIAMMPASLRRALRGRLRT